MRAAGQAAEWIEVHSADAEAPPARAPRQPPGCCRNSTSSGYSSRSGASAAKAPLAGLAVIREGEAVPRPVWPPPTPGPAGCGRAASPTADRALLLELSRTLSAVLGGDCPKSDREVLWDISRSVARRAPPQQPAAAGLVNPINCSLYRQRCRCGGDGQVAAQPDERARQATPTLLLLAGGRAPPSTHANESSCMSCCCVHGLSACAAAPEGLGSKAALPRSHGNRSDSTTQSDEIRLSYPSIAQHDYTTLECSDSSSSEAGAVSKASTWNSDFRGFDKNLDFTLDGLKAERLGRAIAKAKRRRQWCRVLVVIFGLVFFILSVVIVSLSVTRGRKVFGSM